MMPDVKSLKARLLELEGAICRHHAQTQKDMCWENDVELWAVIGIEDLPNNPEPWCQFMKKCAEYRASREPEKR